MRNLPSERAISLSSMIGLETDYAVEALLDEIDPSVCAEQFKLQLRAHIEQWVRSGITTVFANSVNIDTAGILLSISRIASWAH